MLLYARSVKRLDQLTKIAAIASNIEAALSAVRFLTLDKGTLINRLSHILP